MKKAIVSPGVIVERVGDDLMVVVPGASDVVSLSGRPADVLLDVQAGRDVDPLDPALKTLSDLGIVTSPGMSRRGLITAGALGAGAGVVMLSMPAAAAAGSGPEDINGGDEPLGDPPISFGMSWSIELNAATSTWRIILIPDLADPNTPTDVLNLTPGTYRTDSGIVVEMSYNGSTGEWEGVSSVATNIDPTPLTTGELTFFSGDADYIGVVK